MLDKPFVYKMKYQWAFRIKEIGFLHVTVI